jgi:hypothetical protein
MRMRLRWNMWGEKKYDEIKEQKIRSNWWYNPDEIKKSEKILLDSDFSIIVGSFLSSHRNVGIFLEWIMNSTCFGAASPIPGQDQVPEVWDTHPIFTIGVSPRSHPTTSHAMHTHTQEGLVTTWFSHVWLCFYILMLQSWETTDEKSWKQYMNNDETTVNVMIRNQTNHFHDGEEQDKEHLHQSPGRSAKLVSSAPSNWGPAVRKKNAESQQYVYIYKIF